jgi:1-acyl-sn-glycerol-3-phosphate acyltransferase
MVRVKGPLLIASNHPNSFLDAIILATLFKNPVYSLARGDAFNGKLITKILTSLNMLPVYRVSEGVENLEHNYYTFNACQDIFKKSGIVLIFSEGRCINEWHLRPLKKGTARLAFTAWQQNIPLKVLPIGINYDSFRKFGKTIHLNFGNFITSEQMNSNFQSAKAINDFNNKLQQQLKELVYEIAEDDKKLNDYYFTQQSLLKKILLFLPAFLGYIIHFPLYYSIHHFIKVKAKDHYDSIVVGLLFFIYPIYALMLALAAFFITKSLVSFLLLLLIPATLLCVLHFKKN